MRDQHHPPAIGSNASLHTVVLLAAVFILVFLNCWGGIALTREAGRIASIWLANGLMVGVLLKQPLRYWPAILIAGWLGNASANVAAGDAADITSIFATCNTLEIVLCAFALHWRREERIDLTKLSDLGWFMLAAILAPVSTASLAAGYLSIFKGAPFLAIWQNWYISDFLGLVVVTPLLLTFSMRDFQEFNKDRSIAESTIFVLALAGVLTVVFTQSQFPLLFLIPPVIFIGIVRLGAATAVISIALTAISAIIATIKLQGPLMLVDGPISLRMQVLQAFLGALILSIMPMAAVLAERNRAMQTLREAQAESDRANRAKGEFLATMSHEIRTPLNSIVGFSGLMAQDRSLAPHLHRQAVLIRTGAEALLSIINDILDISKIDAGKADINHSNFPLRALVSDCLSLAEPHAEQKNVAIQLNYADGLPNFVRGDRMKIQQVLSNLLSNAIKFTPAGTVTIKVYVVGDHIGFSVIDTGIGISPADQEKLFKDFSQVDGTITRRFGGTGLGLSICRRLVTMMGGELSVDSEEGKGSTFRFSLPLRQVESYEVDAVATDSPRIGTNARVLLVDDVDVNLEVAAAYLTSFGHQVTNASSGQQAIDILEEKTFDIVLMDIQMPGMDGLTATRRIRAMNEKFGTLPIIAMTANVLSEQIDRYRLNGMNDHLGKPFKPEELQAMVAKWTVAAAITTASTCLNNAKFGEFVQLLGPERSNAFLVKLAEDLGDRFKSLDDKNSIERDAHSVISSAGMLGFESLSASARALSDACLEKRDYTDELKAVLTDRAATLDEIECRISSAGGDKAKYIA